MARFLTMKAKRKPRIRFHVMPCDELHHHLRDTCPCCPTIEKLYIQHDDMNIFKGLLVSHNAEPGYEGGWVSLSHDESSEI